MIEIMNSGEKHIACVLLVDTSGSMNPHAIVELNEGLREFGAALQSDSKACGCADVCVISFDSEVREVVPFCPAASFQPPQLTANGWTSMNQAIITGLDAIELRKQVYKDLGVAYWKPWIFLLTDGEPNDNEFKSAALNRLHDALDRKKVTFFPMGIGGEANIPLLKQYTHDGCGPVLKATKSNFKEAFVWLSSSMSVISNSNPTMTNVDLDPIPRSISIEL
ncbi:MAG: hypothetical protein Q4F17_08600 [Eubacteriales bacterium]|nr:hypothetical protein [Eubacteriales bacterium]